MSLKSKDRASRSYTIEETHKYNILLDTREIFLYGHEGEEEDSDVDHRMSCNFLKNIKILEATEANKPIFIHQYSIGGCWNAGMSIYDAIKSCSVPVIVITHGIAASMGSIIPQAADLRLSMPHCEWLLHQGSTGIHGQIWKQARSWMEWEEKQNKRMMEIYIFRCLNSEFFGDKAENQVISYINKQFNTKEDWLINAEEAVEYGFCDGIYGEEGYECIQNIATTIDL